MHQNPTRVQNRYKLSLESPHSYRIYIQSTCDFEQSRIKVNVSLMQFVDTESNVCPEDNCDGLTARTGSDVPSVKSDMVLNQFITHLGSNMMRIRICPVCHQYHTLSFWKVSIRCNPLLNHGTSAVRIFMCLLGPLSSFCQIKKESD